jgi:acyl carrier protein
MKKKIIEVICRKAEEVNEKIISQIHEKGIETTLYGKKSILDSLGLVSLIVAVETAIEEELDVSITLADEKAMSQKNSPFKTIGTLADYIFLLLEEQKNG